MNVYAVNQAGGDFGGLAVLESLPFHVGDDAAGGVVEEGSGAAGGVEDADAGGVGVGGERDGFFQPVVVEHALGEHLGEPVGGVEFAERLALLGGHHVLVKGAEDVAGAGAPVVAVGGGEHAPDPFRAGLMSRLPARAGRERPGREALADVIQRVVVGVARVLERAPDRPRDGDERGVGGEKVVAFRRGGVGRAVGTAAELARRRAAGRPKHVQPQVALRARAGVVLERGVDFVAELVPERLENPRRLSGRPGLAVRPREHVGGEPVHERARRFGGVARVGDDGLRRAQIAVRVYLPLPRPPDAPVREKGAPRQIAEIVYGEPRALALPFRFDVAPTLLELRFVRPRVADGARIRRPRRFGFDDRAALGEEDVHPAAVGQRALRLRVVTERLQDCGQSQADGFFVGMALRYELPRER